MSEELKVIISAEIGKLKKEVDTAVEEINKFSKESSKSSGKFSKAMNAIGKAAKTTMKVVATSLAAGAAALVALSESTEEYRAAQAKLTAAFESAGSSAEQAKETYKEMFRFMGDSDTAVEASNHLAKLTTNQQHLAEWTKICQGAYATFGDSLPIEGLTEAANETAKTGQLTGTLADALNWAGVNEEAFQEKLDACNTEAEREALIRETLNGLYAEAAENYETVAADILAANEAQMKLDEVMASLGATVTPLITLFKDGLAGALNLLLPSVQLITEGLLALFNGVSGGAATLQEGVVGIINTIIEFLTTNAATFVELGITLLTSLIEGIAASAPDFIQTVIGLIPTLTEAVIELLPQLLTLGITMLTEIINGIAATIPTVAPQILELVTAIVNTLIENIPVLLEAGITLLTALVDAIPIVIPTLIEALPSIIDSLTNTLIDNIPTLVDAGVELLLALIDAIPIIIPEIVAALPEIIDSIVDALIESIPAIIEGGVELFMGIVDAIPEILDALIEGLGDIVTTVKDNLVEKLKDALDFDWKLPSLKLPKISISGEFSLNPISWPKFSISWAAKGGVFDNTTLFGYGNGSLGGLGENGAEAVVPLENNLGWLDKLAGMLNERMGSNDAPSRIVLMVDGKSLAETTIESINQLTRQTGTLGLNLV